MTLFEALSGRLAPQPGWHPPPDVAKVAIAPAADRDAVPEAFVRSVDMTRYESRQCERTLTAATWITLITAVVLAVISALAGDWRTLAALAALAALCGPVFAVHRRFGQRAAGALLSVLILVAVTVEMMDGGGLNGQAVVTFPILLVIGGLILGKRALWRLMLGSYLSLGLVALFQERGWIEPTRSFDPRDFAVVAVLLASAAILVWVTIDNSGKNIDRVRRSEAEVRLAYERTLEAWGRALEHRDRGTEGHSRRVAVLAVRLAQELGITEPELTRVRWGGLLHDIGKLAIPDRILLKPGPLTDAERRLMNLHPVYARDMLADIPFLRRVVDIPYHHHERWDGKGYPDRLAGESIPLAARIFAVVDQWEALSSDRPYRRAWDRDQIIAHMEDGAGTLFDPHIVRVFLDRVATDL